MGGTVLIHTLFYQNYNYGAMLQAYALYKTLEGMGYRCEELQYSQQVKGLAKKLMLRSGRIVEILRDPVYYMKEKRKAALQRGLYSRYVQEYGRDIRKDVFEDFMQKEFQATKLFYPDTIKRMKQAYDVYITGGDQVWNPEYTDENFFLKFARAGKKIGFSCSAGKDSFSAYDEKKLFQLVKGMDVVSVREENFSRMLRGMHIENKKIADPVFLMTKDAWSDFSVKPRGLPKHYIFAYLLGEDKSRRKAVRCFAHRNGLEVVAIPHVFRRFQQADVGFADVDVADAGPREFVALVRDADFVVTDSFHGTAFSLLMEKQFYNFSRFAKGSKRSLNVRLENAVAEYGLSDRLIDLSTLRDRQIADPAIIDYSKLAGITEKKRTTAMRFLEEHMC